MFWVGFVSGIGAVIASAVFCISLVNSKPWRAMQDAYPELDDDHRS